MESIVVALIGGIVTLAGVLIANSRTQAVIEAKLNELTNSASSHAVTHSRTVQKGRQGTNPSGHRRCTEICRAPANPDGYALPIWRFRPILRTQSFRFAKTFGNSAHGRSNLPQQPENLPSDTA